MTAAYFTVGAPMFPALALSSMSPSEMSPWPAIELTIKHHKAETTNTSWNYLYKRVFNDVQVFLTPFARDVAHCMWLFFHPGNWIQADWESNSIPSAQPWQSAFGCDTFDHDSVTRRRLRAIVGSKKELELQLCHVRSRLIWFEVS